MVKRVLVVLGGSPLYPSAIRRAVELAKRGSGTVTAVVWADREIRHASIESSSSAGEAANALDNSPLGFNQQRYAQMLSEFRSACEAAHVEYRVVENGHNPVDMVASHWRYHDLVVFGMRGLFDYGLVEDGEATVVDMIRSGVRPILAVTKDFKSIRRVLIGYSGSMESAKAMKRYIQMGLWPEASIGIATCGADEGKCRQLLEDAAEYCHSYSVEPELIYRKEPAAEGLAAAADELRADMVVVGDSFRSTWVQRTLGRTTLQLLRQDKRELMLWH